MKELTWQRVATALLLVAALAVTVVLGTRYFLARAQENARDGALAAAQEYTQKMYAWTPENIADNSTFMMGVLTGNAKRDYESRIVDERIVELTQQQQVVSQVTDQGSAVMENTRSTARVLMFLNQSASKASSQQVAINASRQIFTMVREDGKWKISQIEVLADSTLEDAIAPGGDTTDATPVPLPSPEAPEPTR